MKCMKYSLGLLTCITAVGISAVVLNVLPPSSRLVPVVGKTIACDAEHLTLLENALGGSGLDEFWRVAKRTSPSGCATIYSQWYCSRLLASEAREDHERATHELRLRNLGKLLLKLLDVKCETLTRPDVGLERCRSDARQLLDLSNWLEKGDGYENGILGSRCRTIAGIAIARILVDESVPVENSKSLIDELGSVSDVEWIQWVIRAHEHEVPESLAPYVERGETPDDARKALTKASMRGQALLADKGIKVGTDGVGVDIEKTRQARQSSPTDLAIYITDPVLGFTTLEQWERYCFFPDPLHMHIVSDLRATLLFRQCIGGFPVAPLPEDAMSNGKLNDRYLSLTHAAFDKAWFDFSHKKEFMNSDLRKDPNTGRLSVDPKAENLATKYSKKGLGGNASLIYDAVKTGRFDNYLQGDSPRRRR